MRHLRRVQQLTFFACFTRHWRQDLMVHNFAPFAIIVGQYLLARDLPQVVRVFCFPAAEHRQAVFLHIILHIKHCAFADLAERGEHVMDRSVHLGEPVRKILVDQNGGTDLGFNVIRVVVPFKSLAHENFDVGHKLHDGSDRCDARPKPFAHGVGGDLAFVGRQRLHAQRLEIGLYALRVVREILAQFVGGYAETLQSIRSHLQPFRKERPVMRFAYRLYEVGD